MNNSTHFKTPLSDESSNTTKAPESCILVIFGATGDLTARKLIPALYNLAKDGLLPVHFACVGFARRDKDNEIFREEMLEALQKYSRSKPIDMDLWKLFKDKLFYHQSEFDNDEGYESLHHFLNQLDAQIGTNGNRVYYLSTQPSFFPNIIQKLHQHQLLYDADIVKNKWSRVIIEKPFGHDLKSAIELQTEIMKYLEESQVYRIDHYLGKETVQNLLVFRFSNPIFEAVWNNHHVDNIQITVSEDLGIGTRGRFFEEAGMMRDIVQNHVMQLLSLVAMEPPTNLQADAIRDEKVKVLQSVRPFTKEQIEQHAIRGQYSSGFINGEAVKGYREEENVDPQSNVETYVALQLMLDNWRWAGVPFYIRAGKRLPKRATEIAIFFKSPPGYLFRSNITKQAESNVLVMRIQPDEGIALKMNCKVPALGPVIQPVKMDFKYNAYFGSTPPDAYERLICDCMAGDSTLFARDDEVISSWKIITPILEQWEKTRANFPNYPAGMWGPEASEQLLQRSGRHWKLI